MMRSVTVLIAVLSVVLISGCTELQKPKSEPFYGQIEAPKKQELRWSNGKTPKTLDPAYAFGSPDTDLVRALFEGLTDLDSKTLQVVPAVATKWSASEDFRVWTFSLRHDARWSNGRTVTARDFVNSWRRTVNLGENAPHHRLFANISGAQVTTNTNVISPDLENDFSNEVTSENVISDSANTSIPTNSIERANDLVGKPKPKDLKPIVEFGVTAIDNFTLEVSLNEPDKDFPALVAHTVFRPVYNNGNGLGSPDKATNVVSNGAFRFFSYGADGITLDRADYYWNSSNVQLERVRFIPTENAEKALASYRAGELDVVSNAHFEPLALKLLASFEDFRQTTYSALNFYEFNMEKPQFADRRVREALAIALERERLTNDEMDGSCEPALGFIPNKNKQKNGEIQFKEDVAKAQRLLSDAGFPKGGGLFPKIRLLINQNDPQKRIASSVKKMWLKNLGIDVEIILKRSDEFNEARLTGDFDIVRRGTVLPTIDEAVNMAAMFERQHVAEEEKKEIIKPDEKGSTSNSKGNTNVESSNANVGTVSNSNSNPTSNANAQIKVEKDTKIEQNTEPKTQSEVLPITSEAQAISELQAIPLYFPKSYSLVKPYIEGFDTNILDAPSLKNVKINSDWQPAKN